MSQKVKGLSVKLGIDATDFNGAIENVQRNINGLSRELKDVNRQLKFDPKNTDLLAQKQKILAERVSETKKKLDLLQESQGQVNKAFEEGKIDEDQYRRHQTAIADTTSKLKGYEEQLKSVGDELDKSQSKMEKVSDGFTNAGDNLTSAGKKLLPASVAASGALFGLGKAAMDYDTAWIGVQKTMSDDATPDQLNAIKEGIKTMSKEIGASTTEIAAVSEAAGQLGIETDNILEFTKVMVDMGKSTNLSSDVAATTLARFANVTKMSQKDFSRLGSTIVALGNNSATTEAEIASMAMNLGSAGHQVGMTESDIVALAASLSSVGLEAAGGGTAFSKLLIEMQLASETGVGAFRDLEQYADMFGMSIYDLNGIIRDGGKPLNKYAESVGLTGAEMKRMQKDAVEASNNLESFADVAGMSADEFAAAFKDNATEALQSFIKGLSEAGEEGESAIKILDDMGIKETRLRDALLRSSNASDIFNDSIKLGTKAWAENNALTDEAQLRYDSVEGKMNKMKASFNVMAINLGEKLLPHITTFFEWVSKLADKFGALDDGTQKFIVTTVAVVAAGAPVLMFLGKAATGAGTLLKVIGGASKALGLFQGASATAAAATGTLATSSAGASAAGAGMAGSLAGVGSAVGAAAIAAAPFIAAAAAVVAVGVGINHVMSKEVVPSVDLFADALDTTGQTIDEFGNISGATMIKISEETKETFGSYIEMSDGVQEQFSRMYVGLDEITETGIQSLKESTDVMVDSIIAKNTERKDSEIEILSGLYGESSFMTEENRQTIEGILNSDYENREKKTEDLRIKLKGLYDDMANDAEGGTQEQKMLVENILQELAQSAADVMTKSAVEREVIMQKYNAYEGRTTTEQASKIISELETQKNETIQKAEETKNEQIRVAEELRSKGGEEAEKMADKIISEANRQYSDTVLIAKNGKKDAVDKLIEANKDLSKSVDTESGKIKTGWDKLSSWWDNLWFKPKEAKVKETYESSGGQKHNNGLLNVPYNGYEAILHRNERVLTASENAKLKADGFIGNRQLANTQETVNQIDNSVVNNTFTLGGTYHIREEQDITKVARELHRLQLQKARG